MDGFHVSKFWVLKLWGIYTLSLTPVVMAIDLLLYMFLSVSLTAVRFLRSLWFSTRVMAIHQHYFWWYAVRIGCTYACLLIIALDLVFLEAHVPYKLVYSKCQSWSASFGCLLIFMFLLQLDFFDFVTNFIWALPPSYSVSTLKMWPICVKLEKVSNSIQFHVVTIFFFQIW